MTELSCILLLALDEKLSLSCQFLENLSQLYQIKRKKNIEALHWNSFNSEPV